MPDRAFTAEQTPLVVGRGPVNPLATVGAFRVVSSRDLRDHDAGPPILAPAIDFAERFHPNALIPAFVALTGVTGSGRRPR